MEYLTALATILQLIGVFRQEKGRREDLTSEEFMNWLGAHRHNELKDLIANTHHLQDEVNRLLREDHQRIMKQLDSISELILALTKQFDSLSGFGDVGSEQQRLPSQALDLLESIERNDQMNGVEPMHQRGGLILMGIPAGMPPMPSEPGFIIEDCHLLENLGYLRQDLSPSGNERFYITRAGSEIAKKLIQEIDQQRGADD